MQSKLLNGSAALGVVARAWGRLPAVPSRLQRRVRTTALAIAIACSASGLGFLIGSGGMVLFAYWWLP